MFFKPFALSIFLSWAALGQNSEMFVGSKASRVFHIHPECPSLKKIAEENRIAYANRTEAESDGRRLCKHCERLAADNQSGARPDKQPADDPSHGLRRGDVSSKTGRPDDAKSVEDRQWVRIVRVLPGGSLRTETGETFVLWGVCIPTFGQDQAREALTRLEKAVSGRSIGMRVYLVDGAPERDDLGRTRVRLTMDDDQKDLAIELLRAGLAWVDRDHRGDGDDDYVRLETEAWEAGRGIWTRLSGAAGRREVTIGRYARHYHAVDCEHVALLTDAINVTLNEARARRLTPCDGYRGAGDESRSAPGPGERVDSGRKRDEKK